MTPDFHFSSQMVWIYSSKYPSSFFLRKRLCISILLAPLFWFYYQSNCSGLLVGQTLPLHFSQKFPNMNLNV